MYQILIIEDEKDTANPVKGALELEGFMADIANNGDEAIKMFGQKEYDLVLLDIGLPGMSGEEVLRRIRDENPYVYVIVYTNYEAFEDIKKLTNIGIDGYINKGGSADLSELVKIIKDKLKPLDEIGVKKLLREDAIVS
ncbi:MAG: response regulator [Selenomonas ruminantium]|jgi:DNA-binding response OmpR family regulator|uniref:Response regulator n=1 Tax=Selenomonas ruminantium TaxID=971 RepID=A0A927ZSM6_SELRU|nr:response regulator [Selenomonas ruminantium]MBE6085511.1 response regulator [Selenomonas ruminantium]